MEWKTVLVLCQHTTTPVLQYFIFPIGISILGAVGEKTCDRGTDYPGQSSGYGVRQLYPDAGPQLYGPPRGRVHHHGGERLREKHASEDSGRAKRADEGTGALRG